MDDPQQYGWYHPDVDGDGVGSGYGGPDQQAGWVIYNTVYWDNCPDTYNPYQEDSDGDGWGDSCDPEPLEPYDPNRAE